MWWPLIIIPASPPSCVYTKMPSVLISEDGAEKRYAAARSATRDAFTAAFAAMEFLANSGRGYRMQGRNPSRNVRGGCVLMISKNQLRLMSFASLVRVTLFVFAFIALGVCAQAQEADVAKKLQGFDAYMDQTLKDWNTPGVGVGI